VTSETLQPGDTFRNYRFRYDPSDGYGRMEHRFDFTNFNTWKTNVLIDAVIRRLEGQITGIPSPFLTIF
jgi:hypothetical protein